jgi:uncharacterized protein YjiS (DUF1127 family)
MSNEYYDHSEYPATGSLSSSSAMRDELDAIEHGFGKLPRLKDAGGFPVFVKLDESGLETRPLYSYDGEPVELLYKQYMSSTELDARTVYFIPDWMDNSQAIVFNNVVYHVLAIEESEDNLISMTEGGRILLDRNNVKLASPVLTGTPIVPTAAAGTNTDQAASTKFVRVALVEAGDEIKISTLAPQAAVTSNIQGKSLQTTPQVPAGSRSLSELMQLLSKYCHWHNSIDAPNTHCTHCSYCTYCSFSYSYNPSPAPETKWTIDGTDLKTIPQITSGTKSLDTLMGLLTKYCHWHDEATISTNCQCDCNCNCTSDCNCGDGDGDGSSW